PRVENLRRMCVVLNVAPHELLGLEPLGAEANNPKEELKPRADDSADMRRLVRRMRKLSPAQVKLLSLIAGAMVAKSKPARGRKGAA
ncbi:MAG TPA: XRE family transcriptional regulator, partial [Myxococcaceae bacterium]